MKTLLRIAPYLLVLAWGMALASPALGITSPELVGLLFVVILVAGKFVDDQIKRHALKNNSVFKCYRCGVLINPFDGSEDILVAGKGMWATSARVCKKCADRDRLTQTMGWIAITFAFAVTIALILLK